MPWPLSRVENMLERFAENMRSIMTNNCMSQFSGTGQKGKLAFIGTPLYKIILCKY